MKVSPLTEEQIKLWPKLQFYLTDAEIEDRLDGWHHHLDGRSANYRFTMSSSSYTGHRFITFLFEQAQEAALFRLFVGDDGKQYEPEP